MVIHANEKKNRIPPPKVFKKEIFSEELGLYFTLPNL
jgi:hypothetical protein